MTADTRILERVEHGDAKAAEELLPLVYDQLRQLAAHKIGVRLKTNSDQHSLDGHLKRLEGARPFYLDSFDASPA